MPQPFRHRGRAGDARRCHDGLDVTPCGGAAPAPKAQRRKLRISLRDPQLENAVEFPEHFRRQSTCRTIPRLRRLRGSMLTTPPSMSIAAGVSASTSEMRAPLHLSIRQNKQIFAGMRRAAWTKRCRSWVLRYFRWPNLLKRLPEKQRCSRIRTSAETEWPILFQQERYSPNYSEPAHSHADAMQIFRFCMAAFAILRLCCDLLGLWRARRDSNSRPPDS